MSNPSEILKEARKAIEAMPAALMMGVNVVPKDGVLRLIDRALEGRPSLEMARIQRLKDAIEGECEGLAITDEHAKAILEYVDETERSETAVQRPAGEVQWIAVTERLPEPHASVALLDMNRLENVDWGRNIHDCGFWEPWGGGYWSVRGERAISKDAYTHWIPLPPVPTASGNDATARSDDKETPSEGS